MADTDTGYEEPQSYSQEEALRRNREALSGAQESTWGYLRRRAIPFASAIEGYLNERNYGNAMRRYEQGQANTEDVAIIAQYERLQEIDRQRSTGEQIVSNLARIPAMAGEAAVGGAVARGIGGAIGAAGRLGRIGSAVAQNAASTAAMPSFYLEEAGRRNVENGREANDIRGFPAPFAMGMLQNAILGTLNNRIGGRLLPENVQGISRQILGRAIGTGLGLTEQHVGVDLMASAIDTVLPEAYRLQTGHGPLLNALQGNWGEAWKQFAVSAATFGAFSLLHQVPKKEALKPLGEAMSQLAKDGVPRDQIPAKMQEINRNIMQAGPDFVNSLEPGPVKEYAQKIVDTMTASQEANQPKKEAVPNEPGYDRLSAGLPAAPGPAMPDQLQRAWLDHFPDSQAKVRDGRPVLEKNLGDGYSAWITHAPVEPGRPEGVRIDFDTPKGAAGGKTMRLMAKLKSFVENLKGTGLEVEFRAIGRQHEKGMMAGKATDRSQTYIKGLEKVGWEKVEEGAGGYYRFREKAAMENGPEKLSPEAQAVYEREYDKLKKEGVFKDEGDIHQLAMERAHATEVEHNQLAAEAVAAAKEHELAPEEVRPMTKDLDKAAEVVADAKIGVNIDKSVADQVPGIASLFKNKADLHEFVELLKGAADADSRSERSGSPESPSVHGAHERGLAEETSRAQAHDAGQAAREVQGTQAGPGGPKAGVPAEANRNPNAPAHPNAGTAETNRRGTVTDPAAINAKTWHHGSPTKDITKETAASRFTDIESLMGTGVYLTDNPKVAAGYAAKNPKKGAGQVYDVKVNVDKVLDLEKEAPQDFRNVMKELEKREYGDNLTEALKDPKATAEDLIHAFQEDIRENGEVPKSEYVEDFQQLESELRGLGYDAMTHTGGGRVGKVEHQVLILLDPRDEMTPRGRERENPIVSWNKTGEGAETITRPAEIDRSGAVDGWADRLAAEPMDKPGVANFFTSKNGFVDFQQIKDYLQKSVNTLRDTWNTWKGHIYPTVARFSEKAANSLAFLISAPEFSKRFASVMIDRVMWAGAQAKDRIYAGATLTEMRLERMQHFFTAVSADLRIKEAAARATGDLKEAARYARLAATAGTKSLKVGTIVGQVGSPFALRQDYHDALNDPKIKSMIDKYRNEFAPEIDRLFRESGGDPTKDSTQIPGMPINLVAVKKNQQTQGGTYVGLGRGNLRAPKIGQAGFMKEALGQAQYSLDIGDIMTNAMSNHARYAAKRGVYDTFKAEGLGEWGRPGARDGYTEFKDLSPPRGIGAPTAPSWAVGGQPSPGRGESSFFVKNEVAADFRKAFGPDEPFKAETLKTVNGWLTKGALLSTVEAAYHSKNLLTMMMNPGMSIPGMVYNGYKLLTKDHAARLRLAELARTGVSLPATTMEAPNLGGKLNPMTAMGKGLHFLRESMILTADDAFTRLAGIKSLGVENTEINRRNFINQLGQYNIKSQAKFIQFARDTGLGPFATAGTNYYVQGISSLLADPGIKTKTMSGQAILRTWKAAKLLSVAGIAAAANYIMHGRVDGDENTPLGAVKVGTDERGQTKYADLVNLTGLTRGLRETGLLALAEGVRQGRPAGAIADRAAMDAIQSALHPFEGPPVAFVHTLATGENTIGGRMAPRDSTSRITSNLQAAVANANPLVGALGGFNRSPESIPQTAGERAQQLLGPYGIKSREDINRFNTTWHDIDTQRRVALSVPGERFEDEARYRRLSSYHQRISELNRLIRRERAGGSAERVAELRQRQNELARMALEQQGSVYTK